MSDKTPLYVATVAVSREYLGPAGERFMRRQIEMHLRIKPEELSHEHIPKLIIWSKLAFSMLTEDQDYVDSFADDLGALGSRKESRKNASH
jgi:hypothetical protein